MDVCCLQEVRWRGQEAQFVGAKSRRYKLWWNGSNEEMMNVDRYIEIIQCKVMTDMKKTYSNRGRNFQQVLAPCYTAKKVKKSF